MDENREKALLCSHAALYPGLEIEDLVKLLYQSEFGCGHLIDEEERFCEALCAEREGLVESSRLLSQVEPIGGGYSRVHLAALPKSLKNSTLARLCALSAEKNHGTAEGFLQRLKWVPGLIEEQKLPIAARRWNRFIEQYSEKGCPPLHHSERYRALYAPHYRVLAGEMAVFLPVFAAVDRAMAQAPKLLVCIDGMSGSGKSSLAGLLAAVYGCGVVRADDFFLREDQRSPQRLAQPGGNIDYERLAPVVAKAREGQAFCYQPYSCQTGRLGPPQEVEGTALTVLEGAYSLHPRVGARPGLRVFVCVDAEEQARRVRLRNGPGLAKRFLQEWIPMENRYFAAFSIRESCDVVVDTTQSFAK